MQAGRKIVRDWFPDVEDDDVEVQDDGDASHFFDDTIIVSIDGICPTTKSEFIMEYLNRVEVIVN